MRKLKLDLDDLTVEAFETVKSPGAEGTVMGHAQTQQCGDTVYPISYFLSACPLDCYSNDGFYSDCCSDSFCMHGSYVYSCGEPCTEFC